MKKQKVWESLLLYDTRNSRNVFFELPTEFERESLEWTNVYVEFRRKFFRHNRGELSADTLPLCAFWRYSGEPKKTRDTLPDAFTGQLGVPLVSGRMKAVMERFNLGETSFYPVKLFEYDQETLRPDDLYILDVRNSFSTLVPEESVGIRDVLGDGTKWAMNPEKGKVFALAVDPGNACDIWVDPRIRARLFFTDRLRTGLREADLNLRTFGWRSCKLVSRA